MRRSSWEIGARDWRPLVRGGALGAVLATSFASSSAHACHDEPRDRYGGAFNLGFSIGVAVAPGTDRELFFTYGIDLRLGEGPAVGLLRLEGHDLGSLRFVAGVQLVAQGLAAEGGISGITSYEIPGRLGPQSIGDSLGIHAAAALWDPNGAAQIQGTVPVFGDRRNYTVGTAVFLVLPGRICLPSGRVLRARGNGGAELPAIICAPPSETGDARMGDRRALALAWAKAAQAEYASVPAFERLASELQTLGAPSDLVGASMAAAGDERRHTIRTAAHAGALGWGSLSPDAAAPRFARPSTRALALLAHESLVDGCLGEGVAAALARRALTTTRDERAQATNLAIAHEEAQHAELSWAILSWAWRAGGAAVRDAVMEAAWGVSRGMEVAAPSSNSVHPEDSGGLDHDWIAAKGQPSPTDRVEAFERVRESLLARLANTPITVA